MSQNKWDQKTIKFKNLTPVIIFLVILLIYLLFPTKNYYWDGIEFASVIERANGLNVSLLHPNHLIYNYLGYLAYVTAKFFTPGIRAIAVLQILSSIFGAAGITLFYIILKNLFRSEYINLCLTALLAFSATWWKYSTDGDSYVLSIFFLLTCFYLILPGKTPRPLFLALSHIAAMLFHQLAIFFFPVVLIGLYFQDEVVGKQKRFYDLLKFSATDFLITFAVYCIGFYNLSGNFTIKSFLSWTTSYSPEVGFVYNPLNIFSSLLKSHAKLLFDGRFNFFKFNFIDTFLLILLIITVFIFVGKIIRYRAVFKKIWKIIADREFYTDRIFLLCALWIVPFFLFLAIFIPGNSFYKLFYVPPFVILIGLIVNSATQIKLNGKRQLLLGVVIIFLVNFIFFVHPSNKIREDSPLSMALEMNRQINKNSVIYYDRIDPDNNLVRYFNSDLKWVKIENTQDFETSLVNNFEENKTVWIDESAFIKINADSELKQNFFGNFSEKQRFQLNDPDRSVKFIQIEPVFENNINFKQHF